MESRFEQMLEAILEVMTNRLDIDAVEEIMTEAGFSDAEMQMFLK
jgi:hypothetical protein|nr:MAG TPA: Heat shock factor binding protein 1 [Caudoviricetes sp.]